MSFVVFWVAEAVVRAIAFRERRRALLLPLLAFGLALGYGAEVMDSDAHRRDREQEVIVVQGNGSLAEMKELDSLERVLKRTFELTTRASKPGALIVWPEGSIPFFLPADVGSARTDPSLPWLGDGSALLIGAYCSRDERHRYNSAFAVYPDGSVPVPYFKQILIPFGEYMPGASVFPWLNRANRECRDLHGRHGGQGLFLSDEAGGWPRLYDESGPADLLRGHASPTCTPGDAQGGRVADQPDLRHLVRQHGGAVSAPL